MAEWLSINLKQLFFHSILSTELPAWMTPQNGAIGDHCIRSLPIALPGMIESWARHKPAYIVRLVMEARSRHTKSRCNLIGTVKTDHVLHTDADLPWLLLRWVWAHVIIISHQPDFGLLICNLQTPKLKYSSASWRVFLCLWGCLTLQFFYYQSQIYFRTEAFRLKVYSDPEWTETSLFD